MLSKAQNACIVAGFILLVLGVGRLAWAGDAGSVQRSIDYARDQVQTQTYDRAEDSLNNAEKQLDGLDDATKTPLVKSITELRQAIAEGKKKEKRESLVSRIQRQLDFAKETAAKSSDGPQYFKDNVLKPIDDLITSDDGKALLTKEDVKGMRAQMEELVKLATASQIASDLFSMKVSLDTIEGTFDDLQAIWDRRSGEHILDDLKRHSKDLGKLPQDDPAVVATKKRVEEVTAKYMVALKKYLDAQTDKQVAPYLEDWDKMRGDTAVAAETAPPTFEQFAAGNDLATKAAATVKQIKQIDEWLNRSDSDGLRTSARDMLKKYPDQTKLAAAIEEANKLRVQDAEKVCQMGNQLLDSVEKQPAMTAPKMSEAEHYVDHQKNVGKKLGSLGGQIKEITVAAPSHDATLARANNVVLKWSAQVEAVAQAIVQARKQIIEKLSATADATWAGYLKSIGNVPELDPGDAVRHEDNWKGKYALIKGGLESPSGYDSTVALLEVEGVPIRVEVDQAVGSAQADYREQTGLNPSIDQRIVQVKSIGSVDKVIFEGGEIVKRIPQEVPVVRIMAVRGSGFAAGPAELPGASGGGGFLHVIAKLFYGLFVLAILAAAGWAGYTFIKRRMDGKGA